MRRVSWHRAYPLRTYRELASQLLYTIVHEVNNYSDPFPQRKASFLVVVSMTKSLLMHYKQDHNTKKLGNTQNELMKFLDMKKLKSIDDYMERVTKIMIDILSEIAVVESIIYPNLGVNVW